MIIGIFNLTNLLHYSITTFNNLIISLPFGIRHLVQAILAFCLPFYSIYQGFALIFNRLYRIAHPIYRAITLVVRIFTFFIEFPMRIITFIPILLQKLLKNLLVILILAGILIGLLVLFSNEEQLNSLKSYLRNTTDILWKQSSKLRFIPIFSLDRYNKTEHIDEYVYSLNETKINE